MSVAQPQFLQNSSLQRFVNHDTEKQQSTVSWAEDRLGGFQNVISGIYLVMPQNTVSDNDFGMIPDHLSGGMILNDS